MALARSDISIADATPHTSGGERLNFYRPGVDENSGITSWDSLHNYHMGKLYKFQVSNYSTLIQRWCDFQIIPQTSGALGFVDSFYPRTETGSQINFTGVGFILDGDLNSIVQDILFGIRIKVGGSGAPADFRAPLKFTNFYNPASDSSPVSYFALGDSLGGVGCPLPSGGSTSEQRIVYGSKQLSQGNYYYLPLGNNDNFSGVYGHNESSAQPGGCFGYRADRDKVTDQGSNSINQDLRARAGHYNNSYMDGPSNYPYNIKDIFTDKDSNLKPFQSNKVTNQRITIAF